MKKIALLFFVFSLVCMALSFLLPFVVQAGTLQSDLSWTNTDSINKIQVVKGSGTVGTFTEIAQVLAGQTTYTDATNNPGETACYKVAYINSAGVGPYAGPVCKTFPPLPSATPGTFQVR
jgi:hypothetical protein